MSASRSRQIPALSSRLRTSLVAVASIALLALALWVLHGELTHIHLADVRRAFGQVGWPAFALALLATAGSYLALTGYDLLALRHLKQPLSCARIALTSFIATAVGHNLGMAMLTAGVDGRACHRAPLALAGLGSHVGHGHYSGAMLVTL